MRNLKMEMQYLFLQVKFFIRSFVKVKVLWDPLGLYKYVAIRICFGKCYQINFRLPKWY